LLKRLASDLSVRYGRGFSKRNLEQMRLFYVSWPIAQTLSAQLTAPKLPLPWSAYVRLLSVTNEQARKFYEAEALRGGLTQFFAAKELLQLLLSARELGNALGGAKLYRVFGGEAQRAGNHFVRISRVHGTSRGGKKFIIDSECRRHE
jgi:DUF1016 N-terminal domain